MTVVTPPGWYPNPDGSRSMRYWDGSAWTEHLASGPPLAVSTQKLRPGLVAVWITAVLSLATFFFSWGSSSGDQTTIAIPVGVGFMLLCWRLIREARAHALAQGIQLPGAYTAARVVSAVLASCSVLSCVIAMTN